MKGLRTRYLDRQDADRNTGHLAVEELVDDLIAAHGADARLRGEVMCQARSAYLHGTGSLHLVDSRAFLTAAHASLDAFERVLLTAKQMEVDGDRGAVPLLLDLKRRVTAARNPHALAPTRRRRNGST